MKTPQSVTSANSGSVLVIDSQVNGMMIEDKIVTVCPFKSRNERPQAKEMFTNVYLKNLNPEVTDESLAKAVEGFGKVTSCKVMRVSTDNAGAGSFLIACWFG